MTDLLRFPDDETKAFRRARAERVRQAERDARIVQSCVVLLNDCIAARPGRDGQFPALDLARWMTEANALLHEVKGQPAQIRLEARVAKLSLQLKGLVDEAELERFEAVPVADFRFTTDIDVRGAIAAVEQNISGEGFTSLEMAREVNDDLRNRLGARRAPVAALTPDLVSDNLRIPGAPLAGRCAADLEPVSSRGAKSAAACLHDVFRSFFHGATMPRLLLKVLEKGRGLFSRARGGA